MKRKIFVSLVPLVILPTIAPIVSSCSMFDSIWTMPRAIDGSNWTGMLDGLFTPDDYIVDKQKAEIHYWNAQEIVAENLVIPNYVWYDGIKCKVIIDPLCFIKSKTILGSVELNDWMIQLPEYVFDQCPNITSIIFHNYPTSFGDFSLNECISLTNIYVKDKDGELKTDWSLHVESIGNCAFANTAIYGDLTITDSVKKLGDKAFYSCDYLTSINLSFAKKLESVSPWCFANCSLISDVILSSSIHRICSSAFYQCSNLEEVYIPNQNQKLDFESFAFYNCQRFKGFSLEPVVSEIGESCFYSDKSLNFTPWLNKNNTDLFIAKSAFGFSNISGIAFDPTINVNIDMYAFSDCYSLQSIDFSSYSVDNVPEWDGLDIFASQNTDGGNFLVSQQVFDQIKPEEPILNDWTKFFYKTCGFDKLEDKGWRIITKI